MNIPNEVKALSILFKDNKLKIIFLGNSSLYWSNFFICLI